MNNSIITNTNIVEYFTNIFELEEAKKALEQRNSYLESVHRKVREEAGSRLNRLNSDKKVKYEMAQIYAKDDNDLYTRRLAEMVYKSVLLILSLISTAVFIILIHAYFEELYNELYSPSLLGDINSGIVQFDQFFIFIQILIRYATPYAVGFVVAIIPSLILRSIMLNLKHIKRRDRLVADLYLPEETEINNEIHQIQKDLTKFNMIISEQLKHNHRQLEETITTLKTYYDLNDIVPKYRTYEAVVCFLDFFRAKLGTELIGPHGAYMFFENKLNADQIKRSVDNLYETLSQQNESLFMSISSIRDEVKTMAKTLDQVSSKVKNMELEVITTRIVAQNAECQASLAAIDASRAALDSSRTLWNSMF